MAHIKLSENEPETTHEQLLQAAKEQLEEAYYSALDDCPGTMQFSYINQTPGTKSFKELFTAAIKLTDVPLVLLAAAEIAALCEDALAFFGYKKGQNVRDKTKEELEAEETAKRRRFREARAADDRAAVDAAEAAEKKKQEEEKGTGEGSKEKTKATGGADQAPPGVRFKSKKACDSIPAFMKSLNLPPRGLFTGFTVFDKLHGRIFCPGEFVIIAGRPGVSKTAFALDQIEKHAAAGVNVLMWTLEMSTNSLYRRLIAKKSGVSVKKMKNRELAGDDWPKITIAANDIAALPIYISDTAGATAQDITAETTALHEYLKEDGGEGLGLVVVDYLQLATSEGKYNAIHEEVAAVSESLRQLALKLDIPIMSLAQLNRDLEKRGDKHPLLADLAESGKIERDAHIVMFLHRESLYCDDCQKGKPCNQDHAHKLDLVVRKNRDGEWGITTIYFDGSKMQFLDLDAGEKIMSENKWANRQAEEMAAEEQRKAAKKKSDDFMAGFKPAADPEPVDDQMEPLQQEFWPSEDITDTPVAGGLAARRSLTPEAAALLQTAESIAYINDLHAKAAKFGAKVCYDPNQI